MRFHGPVNILGRMVAIQYVQDLTDGDGTSLYGQIVRGNADGLILLNEE